MPFSRSNEDFNALFVALEGDLQTLLDVTFDLAWSGLQDDAFVLLESCPPDEKVGSSHALVHAFLARRNSKQTRARR